MPTPPLTNAGVMPACRADNSSTDGTDGTDANTARARPRRTDRSDHCWEHRGQRHERRDAHCALLNGTEPPARFFTPQRDLIRAGHFSGRLPLLLPRHG